MPVQEDKTEEVGKPQVAWSNPPGAYRQTYALGRGKTGASSTSKLEEVCANAQPTSGDKGGTSPAGLSLGFPKTQRQWRQLGCHGSLLGIKLSTIFFFPLLTLAPLAPLLTILRTLFIL